MKIYWLCFCACLLVLAGGCAVEADSSATQGNSVPFKGVAEERFAGTWKTTNGVSVYELLKDGTYKLESKIAVRGQAPFTSRLQGEWRVSGDRMLFKDGNGNVVPYAFVLNGDTLTLTLTGMMKNKTVMKRQ